MACTLAYVSDSDPMRPKGTEQTQWKRHFRILIGFFTLAPDVNRKRGDENKDWHARFLVDFYYFFATRKNEIMTQIVFTISHNLIGETDKID